MLTARFCYCWCEPINLTTDVAVSLPLQYQERIRINGVAENGVKKAFLP